MIPIFMRDLKVAVALVKVTGWNVFERGKSTPRSVQVAGLRTEVEKLVKMPLLRASICDLSYLPPLSVVLLWEEAYVGVQSIHARWILSSYVNPRQNAELCRFSCLSQFYMGPSVCGSRIRVPYWTSWAGARFLGRCGALFHLQYNRYPGWLGLFPVDAFFEWFRDRKKI